MIHIIYTDEKYETFEEMVQALKPTYISDEEQLKKYLKSGNDIYGYIDPYDLDMSLSEDKTFNWNIDKDMAEKDYDISNDEI